MRETGDVPGEDGRVDPRAGVRAWLKALDVRVLGPLAFYQADVFQQRVAAVREVVGASSRIEEFERHWGGTIVTFGDRFVVNGVGNLQQFCDLVVVATLDDVAAVFMHLGEGYVWDGCCHIDDDLPSGKDVMDRSYIQWLLRWVLVFMVGEVRRCSWGDLCSELGDLERVDALSRPNQQVWVGDDVLVKEYPLRDGPHFTHVPGYLVRRTEGRLPTSLPEI